MNCKKAYEYGTGTPWYHIQFGIFPLLQLQVEWGSQDPGGPESQNKIILSSIKTMSLRHTCEKKHKSIKI
jgi:hypothetical protein